MAMASAPRLSDWPGAVLTALGLPENEPGGAERRLANPGAGPPCFSSHRNFKVRILRVRPRCGNADKDVTNSVQMAASDSADTSRWHFGDKWLSRESASAVTFQRETCG